MSHTRYASVIFTLFLLSILSVNAAQVNAVGDYWALRKSVPSPIYQSAGAVVRGQVYVMGGFDAVLNVSSSGRPIPSNIAYDPASDSWKTLAQMPTVRQQLGAVAVNDRIYTIGGDNRQGRSNMVEVYDPINNTWTSMRPLPVATTASATSAAGSTIYVIGGVNSTVATTAVWAFDTVHNVWTRESNMPAPLTNTNSAAITIGDRIYVAPKNPEQPNVPSLVYNITSNSWSDSWPSPPFTNGAGVFVSPRFYALAASSTTIFLLGGLDPNVRATAVAYNFEYNTTAGIWTRNGDMPTPRHSFVAATVNGLVYAIGGGGSCTADFTGACIANEVYVPRGVQAQFPTANQSGSVINWTLVGIVAVSCLAVVAVVLYYRHSRRHISSSQSLPPA